MQERTEICITVDTEFSIAGHFEDPERFQPLSDPVVYCEVEGKQHGLGFLLETFEKYSIPATFFVECANKFYFGDLPMRIVIDRLKAAHQDIQLHIHPVWLSFNSDQNIGHFPRNDDCSGRNYEDLKRAFQICIEIFEQWVGNPPLAIRTGSLRADENVYRVIADLGVPMASNLALGVFQPKEALLHHKSGRHLIHKVMELPVFTYRDMNIAGKSHYKSLQITSCSWPEMKKLMWTARRKRIKNIVLLTHPFEYVKKSDFQYTKLIRNRINQQRLQKLCQFIDRHDQDFVAVDFTGQQKKWCAQELKQPDVHIPTLYGVGRKLHNKINDSIWIY